MSDWTAIVLTCTRRRHTNLFLDALKQRQRAGCIGSNVALLAAEDPEHRIGSGGATLNALLVATEYLSAAVGQTVATADALVHARILILHLGSEFACDPCGKAFMTFATPLPGSDAAQLLTTLDALLVVIDQLARGCPPGVWVMSSEMCLTLSPSTTAAAAVIAPNTDVTVFAVPCPTSVAHEHGVYQLGPDGALEDLLYHCAPEKMAPLVRADGLVPVVVGLIHLSVKVTETLLRALAAPPLTACTYLGLDEGAEPFELALFLDFVHALCSRRVEADYQPHGTLRDRARHKIWSLLQGTRVRGVALEGATFSIVPPQFQSFARAIASHPWASAAAPSVLVFAHAADGARMAAGAVALNSIVGPAVCVGTGAVVVHAQLVGPWTLGSGAFVSGVHAEAGPGVAVLADNMALFALYRLA